MNPFLRHGTIGVVGGIAYLLIERGWRGYTHWTMFFLGGLCFVLFGLVNELLPRDMPLFRQAAIGAAAVTLAEFFAGLVLNLWLGMGIWDYSAMRGNVLGQICPAYIALWFLLGIPAIILEDWLHSLMDGQPMPRYRLI